MNPLADGLDSLPNRDHYGQGDEYGHCRCDNCDEDLLPRALYDQSHCPARPHLRARSVTDCSAVTDALVDNTKRNPPRANFEGPFPAIVSTKVPLMQHIIAIADNKVIRSF